MEYLSADDSRAVSRWRDFMRFRSISGEGVSNGSYRQCVEFLTGLCTEVGLQVETLEPVEGKPIIIATLVGSEPSLGRIVLNSHYAAAALRRPAQHCRCAQGFPLRTDQIERPNFEVNTRASKDSRCARCVTSCVLEERIWGTGTRR